MSVTNISRMQRMGSINASSTAGTSAGVPKVTVLNTMTPIAQPASTANWLLWGALAIGALLLLKKSRK